MQMNRYACLFWIVIVTVTLGVTLPIHAEEDHPSIVVWKLAANEGVKAEDVNLISNFVTNHVAKYSGAKVISEADIHTILKGVEKRQECGVEDTSCVAEIGAALGVPEAISGDIGRLGTIWVLNLRRINVRTTEVIGRSSRQVEGEVDDLVLAIPSAAAELFGIKLSDQPGTLILHSLPSGARVSLDNEEIGVTPLKHRTLSGSHTVVFSSAGYFDEKRVIELNPHERLEVMATLRKIPPNPYPIAGHATFWSGAGLIVTGGILNWQAGEKQKSWEDTGNSSDKSANHALMGSAIAGYALGGALMITGAVLWILDPGDEALDDRKDVSVEAGPDGRGGVSLLVRGRW